MRFPWWTEFVAGLDEVPCGGPPQRLGAGRGGVVFWERGRGGAEALGGAFAAGEFGFVAGLSGFFVWVGDAAMEGGAEGFGKAFANGFEVAEGELAFVELAIAEAAADDVVDERFDFGGGGFGEGAAGGFDGVGEADDGAFVEVGLGAGVAEAGFGDFGDFFGLSFAFGDEFFDVFLLVEGAAVEEGDEGVAVVLVDDVDDFAIEFMFEGEVDAIFDVGADDEGAHARSEVVVRIFVVGGIFDVVFWLMDFADVVVEGADAADGGIGSDGGGGGFGEVGDHEAVVVGAGGLEGHAA